MMNHLAEGHDDWFVEEFPYVFGLVGPPAIPQIRSYLSDATNGEFSRVAASSGLTKIAKRHPATRDEIVETLTKQLQKHERDRFLLNAELIANLIDLGADESAEAIERAFSAGVVDEGYVGDWERVRGDLGVEGLGLPQPRNAYNSIKELQQSMRRTPPRFDRGDRKKKKLPPNSSKHANGESSTE
jgi:hypothetical protein